MGSRTRQRIAPLNRQREAKTSGLVQRLFWRLFSLGTLSLEAPEPQPPTGKPGAHLFWVVSGQGTLEIQGVRHELKPGPLVWFVDTTQPHVYAPAPGGRLTLRGIRFGGECLKNWHDQLSGRQRVEFHLNDPKTIRTTYRQLGQIVQRQPADREWQAHLLLDQMLGVLLASRGALPASDAEPPLPVSLVLRAVAADPVRNWKAKDLVRISRVSYSGLRRHFSQVRQETLQHFIQRNRLAQARRLLADRRLSVREVATELEFTNEFYFSRFFKRSDGRSPTEFRATLNGNKSGPHDPAPKPPQGKLREPAAVRPAVESPLNAVLT